MHCDTISKLLEKKRMGRSEELFQNTGHLDLQRMGQQGYALQNFALYVDLEKCQDPWEEVNQLYLTYREELEKNAELLAPVYAFEDIEKNRKCGKISSFLTVEEGQVCKGETEKLDTLYEYGVRMMTLTWNYPNSLGHPSKEDQSLGLTHKGFDFVERMEELGMIIDVSHLSDRGFYDVLLATRKPFVASHSNARSLCGHSRNLTDDMIRKLAERGGCTGLNFYQEFLKSPKAGDGFGGLEDLAAHAKYIANIGGVEVLGLGSDFDGIDDNPEIPGVECMERIWECLHKAGFTQKQLDGIFCDNVLRVYHDNLK